MTRPSQDDICIVGYGAVLPEAPNPETFWRMILTGHCAIRELSDARWAKELYSGNGGVGAQVLPTHTAAAVDDSTLDATANCLGLSPKSHNRLQILTLAAAEQAFSRLAGTSPVRSRTSVFLGCMDVDETASHLRFLGDNLSSLKRHIAHLCPEDADQIHHRIRSRLATWEVEPEHRRSTLAASSVLAMLRERFGLAGQAALIDAACASSLAALDLGIRDLQAGSSDLVLAGGIESNLGPDTFMLFSRLGALAPDRCLPLDRRSAGLSQGEGAVLFVLERLRDARRHDHRIFAVLRGCGAASDGAGASLFEPTQAGQLRAFQEAYGEMDPGEVDYVECHATGTPVGDATEFASVVAFFGERRLPLGSVKALVGHTKGAAGAVSLLKCVLALEHRTIPPSPYARFPLGNGSGPFVNSEPLHQSWRRRPLLFGISSFGFGGINYHLVVEGPPVSRELRSAAREPDARQEGDDLVLVARHYREVAGVRNAPELGTLRVPPRSLPQIDELQLAALLAVDETVRQAGIGITRIDRGAVTVIGASHLGLDAAFCLSNRVLHAEVAAALRGFPSQLVERILNHRNRYAPATEDTGPGVLNNVLAGRVVNYFDFTGPSMNVDADDVSLPVAVWIAELRMARKAGLTILLMADERFDQEHSRFVRRGIDCWFLTHLKFAQAHGLPIQARVAVRRSDPRLPAGRSETVSKWQGSGSDRWQVALQAHQGADFSHRCFLFTGQGAGRPGMFRSQLRSIGSFQRHFELADRLAADEGLPPVSAWVERPESLTGQPRNLVRNLALCTAEVALFEHLVSTGTRPRILTGFSLGEYPALACAEVLDFVEMLEIVLARDRACPPAHELGSLIAVGAEPAVIAAALEDSSYHVSNLCSPSQTTIAVAPGSLESVMSALAASGLRHKFLPQVPQPYHSPWLAASARRFRAWLEEKRPRFRPPTYPVISSVTGRLLPSEGLSTAAMVKLLSRQLVAPVDFISQVEAARTEGCWAFLEVGPGQTLSTFTSEILKASEHRILELAEFLPAETEPARMTALGPTEDRLFQKLRTSIAQVTGHALENISIEDRFQEDLGVDSLKKASILARFLEATEAESPTYDISAIRSIDDAIATLSGMGATEDRAVRRETCFRRYATRWRRRDIPRSAPDRAIESTVLHVADLTTDGGSSTVEVPRGRLLLVVPCAPAAHSAAQIGAVDDNLVPSLLHRCGALIPASAERELVLVTEEATGALGSGLAAFFKSLRKERPNLFFQHIIFDRLPGERAIIQVVNREAASGNDVEVRYAKGQRWIAELEPLPEHMPPAPLAADAVVVAFGGAKGICRALLERLPFPGRLHLYLAGRSTREQVTESLAVLGGKARQIYYQSLDARNPASVHALLAAVVRLHGHIDLLLNAVGTEKSTPLETKSLEDIEEELSAKVLSAANVLASSRELYPGRVVLFSSVVARWGNPGQTVYAFANGVINQLAEAHNRALGQRVAVAIEWPPWDGVGMTANPILLHRLRRIGLALLDPEDAANLLAADLVEPQRDVVCYADPGDLPLLQLALRDQRPHRAVVGDPSPEGCFRRVLSLTEDRWLADHRIEGSAYLPAASALVMSLCLGDLARGRCNRVDDFQMLSPVEVDDRPISLRLDLAAAGHDTQIRGRSHALHFRCRVGTAPEPDGPRPQILDGESPSWKASDCYHRGCLFHGPAFQVLHEIRSDPRGGLAARTETSRLDPLYGIAPWDRLTQWLDGAFQVLALCAIHRYSVFALPVRVTRLIISAEGRVPPSVILQPSAVETRNGVVLGDVDVFDDKRQMVFRLEGVQMAVTNSGYSSRDDLDRPRMLGDRILDIDGTDHGAA